LRQDRGLLCGTTGQAQCGTAEHHGRQIGLEDQSAAKGLHDQHDLDRAAAKAAEFLGERQTQQPELGILPPQCPAPALGLGAVGATLGKAVVVGEQPVDAVAQQTLLVGQLEVHQSPKTALVRMFFWISLVPP
jgi:hypothetical protein